MNTRYKRTFILNERKVLGRNSRISILVDVCISHYKQHKLLFERGNADSRTKSETEAYREPFSIDTIYRINLFDDFMSFCGGVEGPPFIVGPGNSHQQLEYEK